MKGLTIGFFVLYGFYTMLFGMNAATLHARFGLHAVHLATALMMFAVIDRGYGIGLLSNNGYPHPDTAGPRSPQPEPIITGRRIVNGLFKLYWKIPITKSSNNSISDSNNKSTNNKKDNLANEEYVSYAGSAKRSDVEQK